MGRLIPFNELGAIRDLHRGKTVVHCHGVFDLLHYGHLLHLKSARRLGDLLVVTVTADRFVNKGPGRPRFTDGQRAQMLGAMEFVDYVAINDHPTAVSAIDALHPHLFVKGPDYASATKREAPEIVSERTAVERYQGKIVFTDDATESSSELLNAFLSSWDDEQITALKRLRAVASVDQIVDMLDAAAKIRVLVIGEPTVDTYIFSDVNGTTNKTPTMSATATAQEDYAGGAMAIANHLAAMGCAVTLLIPHGGEPYFSDVASRAILPGIDLEAVFVDGFATPRKSRYVVKFQMNKLFQVVHAPTEPIQASALDVYYNRLAALAGGHDMIVVADYGFGLFEAPGIRRLADLDPFVALNVQTNATNYGFNLFHKHARFDYLSLNEREFRLGVNHRFGNLEQLMREARSTRLKVPFSVTVGARGSCFSDAESELHLCPSFFSDIVDTMGAGDAFFAITALCVRSRMSGLLVPFVGNCFGGLQSRIVGNKGPVAKVDLLRTITALLS